MPRTIYTVGHSTRTLEELVEILTAHGVKLLADVRKHPGSRRLPWFNASNLATALPGAGIEYRPFEDLGGRRKASGDPANAGWRNASFRGYADYMQTHEFVGAVGRLSEVAGRIPTAIMCAEAVPWRCHRSLIADALLVRGWRVLDIYDAAKAAPHKLTPFARVEGTRITYPLPAGPDDAPELP